MEAPRPLLLFLCLLLPASQSPIHSPRLLLEILGPDLAVLLSGGHPSPPPSSGHLAPTTPSPPPTAGHPWFLHLLLQELAKSQPKRLRGRFQKWAQPAGCFGIKLDRIGTFSGLGC
ncbi:C-type natriuretic peptide-like [Erythrolamprus reginae]|uniref:C-type natriuretic peptide-like n=1 Tax=Erythrolamprus reginae TaxID=121349 RepID=UPI00396C6A6A